MDLPTETIEPEVFAAERLWLFLDYDGTLAEFSPTPDHIAPDREIIRLVRALAENPFVRVSVISGRRLSHIRELLPIDGIWLAGTYGVEFLQPDGTENFLIPYQEIRPLLESIKPEIERVLSGKDGFYLEDKGWALAIHARFAADDEAAEVLNAARQTLEAIASPSRFRILGGNKFLEIGPAAANKGTTVEWLMERFPFPGSLPVYLGDDDKDEEAFAVIHHRGGLAILVASDPRQTQADARLRSPKAAREWLKQLLDVFSQRSDLPAG